MKRTLKLALLASAAVIVLGMATPGNAQEGTMRRDAATSHRAAQQASADRYGIERDYDAADDGSEAYAFAPSEPGGFDSCATEGSYGQGADYSACGGE